VPDVEGGILPPGIRVQIGCDVRIFRAPKITAVLSAGLEGRLYGRQGCPPLQFQLDKFFGSAWLSAMKIPAFKPSKRFVDGIKLPCLVAQIKNSELPGIATEYRAQTRSNPYCDIYLRGKDPTKISAWQRQALEQLFKKNGLTAAVSEGMKQFEKIGGESIYAEFDEAECLRVKKLGFAPYLRIDDVVIDEIKQVVLISADSVVNLLHEHGITIHWRKGRWRFDDGDPFNDYTGTFEELEEKKQQKKWEARWEAVFPLPKKNAPFETDISGLLGTWRYDAAETARVRKDLGASKRRIEEAFSSTSRTTGWYYSPGNYKWLQNGKTARQWEVTKYERKGNRYVIHTKTNNAVDNIRWCDGRIMMSIWSDYVYTRVKGSKRTGKKSAG
jgi:hypothetical protein